MPGYLSQIVSTATASSRTDGLRLRPAVRSRSPIADYDQRLGMADWEATAGGSLVHEAGQGSRSDTILPGETGDPGTLDRPQPRLAPTQLRSSAIEFAHPVPAVAHPVATPTLPAEADTVSEIHGHRRPATKPAETGPVAAIAHQPKQPVPLSTHHQPRPAGEPKQPSIRTNPSAPSLPATKRPPDPQSAHPTQATVPDAAVAASPATAVDSRSYRKAPTAEMPDERVPPLATAPRERTPPPAAVRQRRAQGRAEGAREMRSAGGPRVIIDRLEIEIVPPAPPVPARKPGAGEGVGLNRAGSKIGPLSDPLAAARALSLRYR